MKLSLKELKENNGKLKEFKFLTPVIEVLKKDHGKKVLEHEKFDKVILSEMLKESLENKKLAFYIDTENIKVSNYNNYNTLNFIQEEKKELPLEKKFKVSIGSVKAPINDLTDSNYYYSPNITLTLSDLFVITDEKVYEEYVFELMIAAEAEDKKRIEEIGKVKRATIIKDKNLAIKYNCKVNEIKDYHSIIEFLEVVENGEPKEKFEKLKVLMHNWNNNCGCDCCDY